MCPAAPEQTAAPGTAGPALGAATAGATEDAGKSKVDVTAAELVRRLDAQDARAVTALYGALMRDAFPVEKTQAFVRGLIAEKGPIGSFEREPGKGSARRGYYRLKAERGDWALDLTVDAEGLILGLSLTEPPAPPPPVARSTIPLKLPMRGPFSVFWGGDRLEVNQHVTHDSQRRAADIVVTGPDGRTFRNDGKTNADYFIHGKEVLAVAEGVVATVIDGAPENEPGRMNPYFTTGNIVVLQHAGGLHSAYAHLQPGKIRVKPGAKVKQGQVLGLCGNTGNSSEPHLHFQLQDGPRFEASFGVEAVFDDVTRVRDGRAEKVVDYTFLKGDVVEAR